MSMKRILVGAMRNLKELEESSKLESEIEYRIEEVGKRRKTLKICEQEIYHIREEIKKMKEKKRRAHKGKRRNNKKD